MAWNKFKSLVLGPPKPKEEQEQKPQEMYDKQSVDETLSNLLKAYENEKNPIKKKQNEIKYTDFYCKSGSLSALQKKICEIELRRLQDELRTMPEWEQAGEQAGPGQAGQADDDWGLFSGFNGGKKKSKRTKSKKYKRTKSKKYKRTKSKKSKKSKSKKSKSKKSKRTKK
jgi:hypothetical protein